VEDTGMGIEVRPMKGTLGRGRTTIEDEIQRRKLVSSPKDRAENLMIVDLMRNDLGRISRIGSVGVSRLFEVHKLPTLFQMTSTVKGYLRRSLSVKELLEAVFPSGSVTGTPKLAAMGYINDLETSPRGVYCGAVGRFSPKETTFNVPIRTLNLKRRDGGCHSDPRGIYDGELGIGSGIVADSNPLHEWEESQLKSSFLLDTTPRFSLIETIRFDRGWHRLSGHLARLAASAKYFGFTYDEERVLGTLRRCSTAFGPGVFKVRLLLDDRGETSTEVERIRPVVSPVRLAFANHQTDPMDPFLFHKTTHRPLYRMAQQTARRSGLWDLVFQNRYGEITEGSISNIFARIHGKWCTPPQGCGLLAGIMREELIRRLDSEERPLRTDDLLSAEELLVTNSVRGVLAAQLVEKDATAMIR
jgi:para-aminobenzoate synthetase/4-amino-4-deoxychorismate lyase